MFACYLGKLWGSGAKAVFSLSDNALLPTVAWDDTGREQCWEEGERGGRALGQMCPCGSRTRSQQAIPSLFVSEVL